MLYADDLIVAEDSSAKLQERFGEWQKALESKGLKVNVNKTETMKCAKNRGAFTDHCQKRKDVETDGKF